MTTEPMTTTMTMTTTATIVEVKGIFKILSQNKRQYLPVFNYSFFLILSQNKRNYIFRSPDTFRSVVHCR